MTRRTRWVGGGTKDPEKSEADAIKRGKDKETRLRLAEAMDRLHTFSAKSHRGRHLERYRCRIKVGEQM